MLTELEASGFVNIFIAYAHQDAKLEHILFKHLNPMIRQKLICPWDDRQIMAGKVQQEELIKNFNEADIILCLISPDFIGSDYHNWIETQSALDKQASGEVKVIPILLKSVQWEDTIFGSLTVIPRNKKPIAEDRFRDRAFTEVAREIKRVVEEVRHGHPFVHIL
ncbi:toll/interleukin-1 receptor domain-containing protein [Dictyobacter arantiisoli]|uniref:TIR domain-containing protein n=1 Tax=Dictyobacter arantiisoli TaxID=2014874 RepID=A0A5A5TFT5_9CHLR|nr:toll/interleukin-1 receptor domain-containing protein [Dictyobacter arantiisoli]GCF10217.1 hypothetical protein KDI_37810 [Dictyobacter arantiisoli]